MPAARKLSPWAGVAWLASLTEGLPRRLSIEEYVRIVKDKSLLRQLINICSMAITRAADQSEEALEVLNAAESSLLEVTEKGITRSFSAVHEIVAGSFGTIDNLYKQGQHQVTGLRTFLTKFDEMTSGLQKSELTIIAARPSMGKTALAINIAQNAAIKRRQGRGHLLAGNVEGVAAAPHARLRSSWWAQRRFRPAFCRAKIATN